MKKTPPKSKTLVCPVCNAKRKFVLINATPNAARYQCNRCGETYNAVRAVW